MHDRLLAEVGVEGIVNSTDCCGEWRYYNYSPDIAATVIYTSDASADVFEPVGGGQGTSWTQPLQSFPAPSALQNSTDVLRREVRAHDTVLFRLFPSTALYMVENVPQES